MYQGGGLQTDRQMESVTMLKPLRNPMSQHRGGQVGLTTPGLCAASQTHLRMTYNTYCTATHSTNVTSLTVRQKIDKLHGDNTDKLAIFYCTVDAILPEYIL